MSNPKLEDQILLAVHDCLFSIFHIKRPYPPSATWGCAMSWWQGAHLTWIEVMYFAEMIEIISHMFNKVPYFLQPFLYHNGWPGSNFIQKGIKNKYMDQMSLASINFDKDCWCHILCTSDGQDRNLWCIQVNFENWEISSNFNTHT
jgi:hypothetical protein